MTFSESIQTCFSKYAEFSGRAKRSEYWWWWLFCVLLAMVTGLVSDKISALVSLATLLPSFAVGARRLHDVNRSGWFQLLYLIPFIGWLILIYWFVQDSKEPNVY